MSYIKSIHLEDTSLQWYCYYNNLQNKPIFLQYTLMVVMQQSKYPVFYDGDTPIKLSFP